MVQKENMGMAMSQDRSFIAKKEKDAQASQKNQLKRFVQIWNFWA